MIAAEVVTDSVLEIANEGSKHGDRWLLLLVLAGIVIALYFIARWVAKQLSVISKRLDAVQDDYREYLKESNRRLGSIIENNTDVMKKVTSVLERYQ